MRALLGLSSVLCLALTTADQRDFDDTFHKLVLQPDFGRNESGGRSLLRAQRQVPNEGLIDDSSGDSGAVSEINGKGDADAGSVTAKQRGSLAPYSPSLLRYIPEGYDPLEFPPRSGDDPLPISFSVKVRDIQRIDEKNMDITIEWFVRLFWNDARLLAPKDAPDKKWVNINPEIVKYVWLPTTFIDHVKTITKPTLLVRPESFRMMNDGFTRYSISTTTVLSCPMDFAAYPFDTQICYFKLESYQYTSKDVAYKWHKAEIEVSESIQSSHFDMAFQTVEQGSSSHQNRSFPYLTVRIILQRRVSYHITNTYVPSALFVGVSWLTFLIPPDQVPGRMVLTITTLLTIVSQFTGVKNESPKVSYTKALDQWMITCIMFVFLVLVEFTVITRIRYKAKAWVEAFNRVVPIHPSKGSPKFQGGKSPGKQSNGQAISLRNPWEYAETKVETLCPLVLVIAFLLFNCAYWGYWMKQYFAGQAITD